MIKSLRPNMYFPTASRSGSNYPSVFRGSNGFIRGRADNTYFEGYSGSLNLNEPLEPEAITGTISFDTSSRIITGTSSDFFNELHRGQMLVTLAGEVIVIEEVTSATAFIAHEAPLTTGSGVTAYRMPVLFEIDKARGSLLSGNALEYDRGTILCVGSGTLRKNGQPLNSTLIASRQAKIALYNADTDTYTVQTLGFDTVPVGVAIAAASAPTSKTFTDADVNVGSDQITITTHGWNNGQKVRLSSSGVLPTTTPANELINKEIYIIRIDADTVKFAKTLADTAGTPVAINIASASGGGTHTVTPISKNMPAGDRSIRISKASTKLGTPSFGNPGEKIKVTLTAGQGIAITFPAMDSDADPTNPHDAWRIDASLFGGSAAQATANADSGAWYYAATVTTEELGGTSGGTYYLEYLDAELSASPQIISFDNDYPPRAEFLGSVAGYPVLVSCQGKGTPDHPVSDAPGSSLVPFKPANLAAAPLVLDSGERNEVPLSPPEIIIGCYSAAGRLYLMTANTLQIAVFTADPNFPVATRPFWKSGFKNPYSLCFANDRLYGFTNSPIRSPEEGSDSSIDRSFGAFVKEITYSWHSSRVFTAHDPQNECVCYFYSGAYKNESGFWVSLILPFMLELEAWSPLIILESDSRDCLVSGVATVNNQLEFLMGGRDGAGMQVETYRFDAGLNDGESLNAYIAFQFSDGGSEQRPKKIKYPRLTGRFTNSTYGIHGAHAGEEIDVDALEAGNGGSKSGAIAISDTDTVALSERLQVEVSDLSVYTHNITWSWDGTGEKPRLDEVSWDEITIGGRK